MILAFICLTLLNLKDKSVYKKVFHAMDTECHCPGRPNAQDPSLKAGVRHVDSGISRQQTISCENNKDDTSFYSAYSGFSLGWLEIVNELEWTFEHSTMHAPINEPHRPLNISRGETELEDGNTTAALTTNPYYPLAVSNGKMGMTSIQTTRAYFFEGKSKFKTGDYVHIVIEAYDNSGRRRQRGGDFFETVMHNAGLEKRTAGRVVDYGNGTYSVYFYAAWQGTADFYINLAFTREAILFLKNDILKTEPQGVWQAAFGIGNISEITNCSILSDGTWEDVCEFTNPIALGKTVYICKRPENFTCENVVSISHFFTALQRVTTARIAGSTSLFESGIYNGRLQHADLKAIFTGPIVQLKLPPCGPDIPVPLSDGYWADNTTFVPLMCRSQQWSDEEVKTCLLNKRLYIYGGSTMGQVSRSFKFDFPIFKTFTFLALRLGRFVQPVTSVNFESDVIDTIPQEVCNNSTAVFIVNFSFHFASWTTRPYIERLFQAKLAIVRFLNRCPGSMVLIRLSNPRENDQINQRVHSSDWILYDQNRMIRRVFAGIGVRFIDVWDMVLSHHEPNVVHMPMYIIKQQVEMMLSYMCPEMVRDK
ncbi:NXPE family member 3-like [Glandiceps talaboti]